MSDVTTDPEISEEDATTHERVRAMVPKALDFIEQMIEGDATLMASGPATLLNARRQAAEGIIDRILGRPPTSDLIPEDLLKALQVEFIRPARDLNEDTDLGLYDDDGDAA